MIVSVPVPDFVREPDPFRTPLRVPSALAVPVVRAPLMVIVPSLVSVFSVSAPPRVSVAPEATATAELEERMASPVVVRRPLLTVVEPVKSLDPESATVPAVVLVRLPAPESLAETVPAWKA